MRSTFMGLETARRGMFTQQSALYTTGHNIANANTPGYSRQRVNFTQTEPYPPASMNRPQIPGQVGSGVKAGSIERVRESFLDVQYRGENNKLGYWETRAESFGKLEEVMNEPSDSGLAQTMDMFWQSLQDLAVNPTNPGAKSVVRQRGVAVAETFNYLHSSLSSIQKDVGNEINVTEKEINSVTYQIDQINKQIAGVEPHGYLPNDLYDERDRLIDQLSSLVNINVSYVVPNGADGKPIPNAEGKAIVKLVNDTGVEQGVLVSETASNEIKVNYDGIGGSIKTVTVAGASIEFTQLKSTGKLKGLIESFGYEEAGAVKGIYSNMLAELDTLAFTFAEKFNEVHADGMSLNDMKKTPPTKSGNPFFADEAGAMTKEGFAGRMEIAQAILTSVDNIATANGDDPANATLGDASNALKLAEVINEQLPYGTTNSNFRNYYEGVIGSMAVQSQEAVRLSTNSSSLRQSVDEKRQATSSVSLDEEMSNMIQFQHAYNASARMISLTDELLEKIINGMGTGGR
ncbi:MULTISPECIES: flagellar hook-associated protein FlgK [unclassified Bacillus (in: firmicutes)]|uniref:flagellar hook-associated protein FlgK n=1 Tax=unclassified Bacillus (in: firmicutes) TaxID=185979 RepID=UPI0008EBAE12|nr:MULTISPECIES: flagellar hook-associated protein FlgK [unclassified Bacillus (in: firmicutes)]SFB25315.1 flagellar hook-associated protein 1 FlgK [Bacillus sp. UNCCL13]SFQ91696.1 flagellar hook-associated protein 1 FlgK [Bacillus sp. cl95]